MLHATEVLGAEAYDSLGNFVGRVKEMFIVPDEQPNRISRLLLGRGQFRPLVARYDQIASVTPGRVNLTTDESALELYHPNEAWLAVRKDLLDQQIIDTNGRKVVRVNDVDLADQRTNGNMSCGSPRWMLACLARCGAYCRASCRRWPSAAFRQSCRTRHDPLGIRQPDRARSAAARETAAFQRQARRTPSGRYRRHHGRAFAGRTPVHLRFAR